MIRIATPMKYLAAIVFLLVSAPALAAEPAAAPGLLESSARMLLALLVVLGIILLLYALSRKGFGFLPSAKGGAIEVVEMRSLGPKKGICLVRVRGEELLLGLGADRVEFLARIEGGAEAPSFEQTLQDHIEDKP